MVIGREAARQSQPQQQQLAAHAGSISSGLLAKRPALRDIGGISFRNRSTSCVQLPRLWFGCTVPSAVCLLLALHHLGCALGLLGLIVIITCGLLGLQVVWLWLCGAYAALLTLFLHGYLSVVTLAISWGRALAALSWCNFGGAGWHVLCRGPTSHGTLQQP